MSLGPTWCPISRRWLIFLEGTAALLATASVPETLAVYAEKYVARFTSIGLTLEGLAAQYSQGIRITPTRVVGLIPATRVGRSIPEN